ncbi:MAG TPA: hypothetical protein VIO16_08985, partial [Dehalococcoidia bacterium]
DTRAAPGSRVGGELRAATDAEPPFGRGSPVREPRASEQAEHHTRLLTRTRASDTTDVIEPPGTR